MVTLEELQHKKGMFFVPEVYKKYGMHVKAEDLKNIIFTMIEPPIIRRRPSKKQPEEGQNRREDGSVIVWTTSTAYIPVQYGEKQAILITSGLGLLAQFQGIDRDEVPDPDFKDATLYFYQDKIDGNLRLKWVPVKDQKFDEPILEAAN